MSLLVLEHHREETSAQFGGILQSYGHRLRVIRLCDHEPLPVDLDDVDGLIVMGGPMNVDQQQDYPWLEPELALIKQVHDESLPIVGVCLGAQLIAHALGGQVAAMDKPEVGWHNVKLAFPGTVDPIYAGIGWDTVQFHVHGQEISDLPPGATPLAGSQLCKNQAFRVGLTTYAFQYHFEWDQHDLQAALALANGLLERAASSREKIAADVVGYYDDYRRLGNWLSHTIATVLFPIDKRRCG